MAVLMADSFDFYKPATQSDFSAQQGTGSLVWDSIGSRTNFAVSTLTRFGSGQSLSPGQNLSGAANFSKAFSTNDATVFLCMASYYNNASLGSAGTATGWVLFDGATAQCGVWWEEDGAIRLRAGGTVGGTVLAAYTGAFAAEQWNHFQVSVTINSTTGAIHIRKNGNTVDDFTATGLNTQASANAYTNALSSMQGGDANMIFDDFLYFNVSGSTPTTWVGDVRAIQVMPAIDPTPDHFTPVPNPTGQFGQINTTGPTFAWSANQMNAYKFSPSRTSSLTSIIVNLSSALTGNMVCAVYGDNGSGAPGPLLGQTSQQTNPGAGPVTFNLAVPVLMQGGSNYWLAFWASASVTTTNATTSSANWQSTQTYTGTFPATYPTTTSTTTDSATIYSDFGNFAAIFDLTEDGDSSYIYDSVVGDEDLYGNQAINITPASIIGVVGKMFCRKDNSGSRSGAIQLQSGGTTVNGTSTILSTTYGWLTTGFESTDPNTSAAWTQTGVSSALLGPKVTA